MYLIFCNQCTGLVGALKRAEEERVTFKRLAGTSADEMKEANWARTIPIPTGDIKTTQFDLTNATIFPNSQLSGKDLSFRKSL